MLATNLKPILILVSVLMATLVVFGGTARVTHATTAGALDATWNYQMQNQQNTGYSPQTIVNPSNVVNLHLEWSTPGAGFAGTSVIVNGIVYMFGKNLFAVNESTGHVIWQDGPGQQTGLLFKTRVGVTIDNGNIFAATQDNLVVSLNARTGALNWESSLVQGIIGSPVPYSGAEATPLVYNGRIFIGSVFGDNGARGFLRAFNETNGNPLWTFYTVPPAPINSTNQAFFHNTWGTNGTFGCICGGGSVWNVPAVDPSTGIIYFGVGNPFPVGMTTARAPNANYTNLYTDSVIALNSTTGGLVWYFQEVPGNLNGDLDQGMPVQVFNTTINGVEREVVGVGGKAGYYYELDAYTGSMIYKVPVGIHINENETEPGPSWRGQINTFSSYDPSTNMIYTSADNHGKNCILITGILKCTPVLFSINSTLYGIDASTGQRVWSFNMTGYGGGVSSTNTLVFTTDGNHNFYALDGYSGTVLWKYYDSGGGNGFWSWGPPSVTNGIVFETTFGNTTAGRLEAYSATQIASITVSCLTNSVQSGVSTTCTATVTGSSPSGDVSFTTGSATGTFNPSTGKCTLSSGACSVTYTDTASSSITAVISATYAGDIYNTPAGPATFSMQVVKPGTTTSLTLSCAASSMEVGAFTRCTVIVTGSSPSGNVTFSTSSATGAFTPSTKTCKLSSGTCSITYTDTASSNGASIISASYPGDSTNTPAGPATFSIQVVKPAGTLATATTSTTISSGSALADQTSTTGVSVQITGSTATNGTPVAVNTQDLNGPSIGIATVPLSGAKYFDVAVSGITSGIATVFISYSSATSTTTMQYWTGTTWANATAVTVTVTKVYGQIPVSALTGTNIAIGNIAAGNGPQPVSPPSSSNLLPIVASIVVAVVSIVGVTSVLLRRRGRSRLRLSGDSTVAVANASAKTLVRKPIPAGTCSFAI